MILLSTSAMTAPPDPLHVLVVDDEKSVGFLSEMKFRHAIQNGRIDYHFFESARDCLEYLKTEKPIPGSVVVFTDINMPEVSGYELLKQIKSRFPKTNVYIMSAYDDEKSLRQSLRLGASGYFTKPIDYQAVKSRITKEYGVAF